MTPLRAEEKFRFYKRVSWKHRAICKATLLEQDFIRKYTNLTMEKAFFYNKILLQISNSVTDTTCYERFVLILYSFVVDAVKLHSINL